MKAGVDSVRISPTARHLQHAATTAGGTRNGTPAAAIEPNHDQHSTANPAPTADTLMRDLRSAFHTQEGDERFNAALDFNKDGKINAQDLGLARSKFEGGSAQPGVTIVDDQTGPNDPRATLADLRAAFHTRSGDDDFNAAVDFNNDGVVNAQDLGLARAAMGGGDTTQPVAPSTLAADAAGNQSNSILEQLANAFFSSQGDSNFNTDLDLNGDGRINVADLAAARDRLRDE